MNEVNDISKNLVVDLSIPTPSSTNADATTSKHNMITRRKLQMDPSLSSQMMLLTTSLTPTEPKTLQTALKDDRWVMAMTDEIKAFHAN